MRGRSLLNQKMLFKNKENANNDGTEVVAFATGKFLNLLKTRVRTSQM